MQVTPSRARGKTVGFCTSPTHHPRGTLMDLMEVTEEQALGEDPFIKGSPPPDPPLEDPLSHPTPEEAKVDVLFQIPYQPLGSIFRNMEERCEVIKDLDNLLPLLPSPWDQGPRSSSSPMPLDALTHHAIHQTLSRRCERIEQAILDHFLHQLHLPLYLDLLHDHFFLAHGHFTDILTDCLFSPQHPTGPKLNGPGGGRGFPGMEQWKLGLRTVFLEASEGLGQDQAARMDRLSFLLEGEEAGREVDWRCKSPFFFSPVIPLP